MVWYCKVWYGMVLCGIVRYGVVLYGIVRYGMVWYGMVLYGIVRYGMVLQGMVWYCMVRYRYSTVYESPSSCSFLQSPVTCTLLGPLISLCTLYSNTSSLYSSLSMTNFQYHTRIKKIQNYSYVRSKLEYLHFLTQKLQPTLPQFYLDSLSSCYLIFIRSGCS